MDNSALFLENNSDINKFIILTYRTLLSSQKVPVERLEEIYTKMKSAIHEKAESEDFDFSAFKYVVNRLPECIIDTKTILVGQSESILEEAGYKLDSWKEVSTKSRRRRSLFDNNGTLLMLISSKSDLDDVLPSLILFQIEWKKIYNLFKKSGFNIEELTDTNVKEVLKLDDRELKEFKGFFQDYPHALEKLTKVYPDLFIKNHEASFARYRKETETWWEHISSSFSEIEKRPIFFVSSNSHSLINIVSGFAEENEESIIAFCKNDKKLASITERYEKLKASGKDSGYLLYYLLREYEMKAPDREAMIKRRLEYEKEVGILRVSSTKSLDVPTQIIDLKKLKDKTRNKKLGVDLPSFLENKDSLILNIDYPLGRTAYFILTKIAEHAKRIDGVYVIGKAASLFADRGDILIPSTIFDQHTGNQYFFNNDIDAKDVIPFIENDRHGVYDNQMAVTVLGTLLQNRQMFESFLQVGVTELEMEAGPYLSAVYEMMYPKRYPENQMITLESSSFDLGIIHYVSDNPLGTRKLDSSLALDGVDATYASSHAILNKIFSRLKKEEEK